MCDYVKVVCVSPNIRLNQWAPSVWEVGLCDEIVGCYSCALPGGKVFRSAIKPQRKKKGGGRGMNRLERKKLYVEHFSEVFQRRVRSACLSLRICLGEWYANFLPSTRCCWFFIVTRVWRLPLLGLMVIFFQTGLGKVEILRDNRRLWSALYLFLLRNKRFWVIGYERLIYPHKRNVFNLLFLKAASWVRKGPWRCIPKPVRFTPTQSKETAL